MYSYIRTHERHKMHRRWRVVLEPPAVANQMPEKGLQVWIWRDNTADILSAERGRPNANFSGWFIGSSFAVLYFSGWSATDR